MFLKLLHLVSLKFFPEDAGIVVDIVFEDGLSLLQVESQEPIRIFHRHLTLIALHGSILDQIGQAMGHILECFRVR